MAFVIVLVIIVAIVAGAGVSWAFYIEKPENTVAYSFVDSEKDLRNREEISFLYDIIEGGSIDFEIEGLFLDAGMPLADMSGKLYFSDSALALENFDLQIVDDGDAGDGFDFYHSGEMYISDGFVYVDVGEELGGAYGIEFENMVDEFKNSIFAYGSGSEYAIEDREDFDELVRVLEKYRDTSTKNKKMLRDAERILDKYFKEAWSIVFANAEVTEGETDTLLDGSEGSFRVITITLDEEKILNIVEEIYQFVKSDSSVRDFLDKYETELAAYELFADDENNPGKTLSEKYSYAVAEWGSTREEFKEELINGRVFRDISYEFITSEYNRLTPWKNPTLLQYGYSMRTYTSSDSIDFAVCFGDEGISKTNGVMYSASAIGGTMTYEITENSDERYRLIGRLKPRDEEEIDFFELELDRTTHLYNLKYGTEKSYIKLLGECKREGDTLTLSVSQVLNKGASYPYYEEKEGHLKMHLVFTVGEEVPEAPTEYKSLSEITEGDVDSWIALFESLKEGYGWGDE